RGPQEAIVRRAHRAVAVGDLARGLSRGPRRRKIRDLLRLLRGAVLVDDGDERPERRLVVDQLRRLEPRRGEALEALIPRQIAVRSVACAAVESERRALFAKLLRIAQKTCIEYGLIAPGDRILVALSGGKDSYTMFSVLREIRKRAPFSF